MDIYLKLLKKKNFKKNNTEQLNSLIKWLNS